MHSGTNKNRISIKAKIGTSLKDMRIPRGNRADRSHNNAPSRPDNNAVSRSNPSRNSGRNGRRSSRREDSARNSRRIRLHPNSAKSSRDAGTNRNARNRRNLRPCNVHSEEILKDKPAILRSHAPRNKPLPGSNSGAGHSTANGRDMAPGRRAGPSVGSPTTERGVNAAGTAVT